MTDDLTTRQRSILEFIVRFQQEHLMAPTVREIGERMGLSSPGGIHRILMVLRDKGYILAEPGKKRSWRFTRDVAGRGIPETFFPALHGTSFSVLGIPRAIP